MFGEGGGTGRRTCSLGWDYLRPLRRTTRVPSRGSCTYVRTNEGGRDRDRPGSSSDRLLRRVSGCHAGPYHVSSGEVTPSPTPLLPSPDAPGLVDHHPGPPVSSFLPVKTWRPPLDSRVKGSRGGSMNQNNRGETSTRLTPSFRPFGWVRGADTSPCDQVDWGGEICPWSLRRFRSSGE